MNSKLQELLTKIAKDHLHIETLQTRKSDGLDFHEVAVWSVEAALKAAYLAGVSEATKRVIGTSRAK